MDMRDPFAKRDGGYPASLRGTPAISRAHEVVPLANTMGRKVKSHTGALSVKLRSRRGNRDTAGRFTTPKVRHAHGTRLTHIGKTEMAPTNVRTVSALVPTGRHVSHANDLLRATPDGGGRRTPSGAASTRLLRVCKDEPLASAASAFAPKRKSGRKIRDA